MSDVCHMLLDLSFEFLSSREQYSTQVRTDLDGLSARVEALQPQSSMRVLPISTARSPLMKLQGALRVPDCMMPRRTSPRVTGEMRCRLTWRMRQCQSRRHMRNYESSILLEWPHSFRQSLIHSSDLLQTDKTTKTSCGIATLLI